MVSPGGPGWKKVVDRAKTEKIELVDDKGERWEMPLQILCVFLGCVVIYSLLFAIGSFLYGNTLTGIGLSALSLAGTWILFKQFGKLKMDF